MRTRTTIQIKHPETRGRGESAIWNGPNRAWHLSERLAKGWGTSRAQVNRALLPPRREAAIDTEGPDAPTIHGRPGRALNKEGTGSGVRSGVQVVCLA